MSIQGPIKMKTSNIKSSNLINKFNDHQQSKQPFEVGVKTKRKPLAQNQAIRNKTSQKSPEDFKMDEDDDVPSRALGVYNSVSKPTIE